MPKPNWWPSRPKEGPMWPNLRGAYLDDVNLARIRTELQTLAESGLLLSYGEGQSYKGFRTLYLVLQANVAYEEATAPLTLYCTVEGYEHGSKLRMAWSFPEHDDFIWASLYDKALRVFEPLTNVVYGDRRRDFEVLKFSDEVRQHARNLKA